MFLALKTSHRHLLKRIDSLSMNTLVIDPTSLG